MPIFCHENIVFTNMKDKLNKLSRPYVVYQFSWPGCENWENNVRKNKRTCACCKISWHLDNCSNVEHLLSTHNLILNDANLRDFRLNLVCHNTKIIDQSNNWNVLLFKETYHIKDKYQVLNNCVEVPRKMKLFWMPFDYSV